MTALELPQSLRLADLADLRPEIARAQERAQERALARAQDRGAALVLDARAVAQIDTAALQLLLAVMARPVAPPAILVAPEQGQVAMALARLGLDRILHRKGDDLTFAKPGDAA